MIEFDVKTLRHIYIFDDIIAETVKKWLQVYNFKQPPENEISKLVEIVRATAIDCTGDENFFLEDYFRHAVFYARFYVFAVVILSKGGATVTEFFDTEDYIQDSKELPPHFIKKAVKILIQVLKEHNFDAEEFIKAGTLPQKNLKYLAKVIAGDCVQTWQDMNYEENFLDAFQDAASSFADFLTTYIEILESEEK